MWWINRFGSVSGPYSDEQVERGIKQLKFTKLHKISSDRQNWRRICDTEFWKPVSAAPEEMEIPAVPLASPTGASTSLPKMALARQSPFRNFLHRHKVALLVGGGVVGGGLVAVVCVAALLFAIIIAGEQPVDGGDGATPGPYPVDEASVKAYVEPSIAEISQLFEYVRNAPNVQENAEYKNIMSGVEFIYQNDSNDVNAYACLVPPKNAPDKLVPVILFCGGMARFGRVASLAVAAENYGDVGAAKRFIEHLNITDLSDFSDRTAFRLIGDAGLASALADKRIVANAKSVSAGLMLGIMAHEAGHQALSHTRSRPTGNLEVSCNAERQADLFAASVMSSSPFQDYMLVGTLFWHYALAMQKGNDAVESTHPHSRERFENLVRANPELAASMGITLEK